MSPFSLFHRATLVEHARQMHLSSYRPEIRLRDLAIGIDNLRHDVYLSTKFVELARTYLALLVAHHGGVQGLLMSPGSNPFRAVAPTVNFASPQRPSETAADLKKKTTDLQVAALNSARVQGNFSIDLLSRLSIIKFFREELNAQFTHTQERCRSKLRVLEAPGSANLGLELRECFARFQVNKRTVLRKCGQDLYEILREIEKETIAHMRRSIFGESESAAYELFLNRLIFSEDGRDDFIKAEHYVMLGNFERDVDRLVVVRDLTRRFFRALLPAGTVTGEEDVDDWLNVPENAQELVGGGVPEDGTEKGRSQRAILYAWLDMLDDAGITDHVLAAYEVVPLLPEYCPLINPQQLKNALISRAEELRIEQLLAEHGKISTANFHAAAKRLSSYGNSERAKIAGRFLVDFLRYNRDLRRLEALNAGTDQVNLINSERMRQLSTVNATLYEFQLLEEQKPAESRVVSHVVLKADVRDSTTLTRNLVERGQNPASYFSLGFYDPVSKLLSRYGAEKIFIEGDALILGILEREGAPAFSVARTAALACEIMAIVRVFRQQSQSLSLPALELGIGICYQDSTPMYLLDGDSRIMISDAINRADRLSSCSRRVRKYLEERNLPFNVFLFKLPRVADSGGVLDDFMLQYNIGGIQLDQPAFQRLRQEISLQEFEIVFPGIWGEERVRLYRGLVPVTPDMFSPIVIREAVVPLVQTADFSLRDWTDNKYYEVCTSGTVYELVEKARARAATP